MKKLLAVASWALPPLVLIAVGVAGYATRDRWESWLPDANIGEAQEHPVDAHAGHDHGDAGDAIVLSDRARRNLGLEVGTIEVGTYWQKLPIPGEVVEIPGRSDLALTSRVAGVVDEVYVLPGQAVRPGRPLFKIQITGDEVITAQSAMVNAIQQTKVNQAEIDRITPLVPNVVPEATLLKIQYDQQKLAVQRDLHEQELRAHGLSDEQIRRVAAGNAILKELTVTAPVPVASTAGQIPDPVVSLAPSSPAADQPDTVYSVASVEAYRGRLVQSGDHLGTLADHADLLVRGHAFEKEGDSVERASSRTGRSRSSLSAATGRPSVTGCPSCTRRTSSRPGRGRSNSFSPCGTRWSAGGRGRPAGNTFRGGSSRASKPACSSR